MGMIEISVRGSFGPDCTTRTFSALEHGHAHAVAKAIEWLSGELLPNAVSRDHQLANEGKGPIHGFGRHGIRPAAVTVGGLQDYETTDRPHR
jgi:hypothetical protein